MEETPIKRAKARLFVGGEVDSQASIRQVRVDSRAALRKIRVIVEIYGYAQLAPTGGALGHSPSRA
ncbi:MAG TPA: hypothetical protein VGM03_09350 [Phycisphaerae bacterium]|jgi:hypothetical protein